MPTPSSTRAAWPGTAGSPAQAAGSRRRRRAGCTRRQSRPEGTPLPLLDLSPPQLPELLAEYRTYGTGPSRRGGGAPGSPPRWLVRGVNCSRFCCVAGLGLANAASPWALAVGEAVTMVLLYALVIPGKARRAAYDFGTSCEDVLVLSLVRAGAALACHFWGTGALYQRPYLYCAWVLGCVSLPLALFKAAALEQGPLPAAKRAAFVLFFGLHAGFALAHMLAARQVSTWARRRYQLGLTGLGYPWEEGEQAWVLAGELAAAAEVGAAPAAPEDGSLLLTPDSLFMTDCLGVTVHYRLAHPQVRCRGSRGAGRGPGVFGVWPCLFACVCVWRVGAALLGTGILGDRGGADVAARLTKCHAGAGSVQRARSPPVHWTRMLGALR